MKFRGGRATTSLADRLFGSHPHLSSLAAKSSHALLAPLGTHSTHHWKSEEHGVLLMETSGKVTSESRGAVGEGEELGRDELNVRDLHLEFIGRDVGVHIKGQDPVVDGTNKDLHPRKREEEVGEASPWLLKSRGRTDSKGREPVIGSFDSLELWRGRQREVRDAPATALQQSYSA